MIGHSVRPEVEWLLLWRACDGELTRVGGVYLHLGRDHATEPIEECEDAEGRQLGADLQVPAPESSATELTIETTTEISQDSADQHMFGVPRSAHVPGDGQLAVLFRQVQWALDDAAHDWLAGRVTPQQREELAETLDALATIVRASIPSCVIIDPQS